jgi:uncharacterized membrane protein
MLTRARWSASLVHRLLVALSLGLFATSLAFDLVGMACHEPAFSAVGSWDLQGGLVGGAIVGVLALADLATARRGSRAEELGARRAYLHYGSLSLFGTAFVLRVHAGPVAPRVAIALAALGIGPAAAAAWLGAVIADRIED